MKPIQELTSIDMNTRVAVLSLAAMSPFLCILSGGIKPSLSSYWNTDLQPLFIIANFLTAYYFLSIKNWRASGLLLLLLTAFSVEFYGTTHNFLAVVFFLVNLYPLYVNNHYRWVISVYLISIPIFYFYGMLWAEIMAIESLCLHQGLILRKINNLNIL